MAAFSPFIATPYPVQNFLIVGLGFSYHNNISLGITALFQCILGRFGENNYLETVVD